ncbi:bifunctional DNA-formamidopyrimidine glycosylase/DNA-(apurinic or apyrimidinic site) lyase [Occallatibacter riparius]|uniref:Formamidopyrimidine-DNA glycosylase n=1 Tax=Occallatibacter riparius TaxID=1002689 RepID=A0A9J7BTN2_9BACT|nr:bifunctional DNA-formamidopyrimidine glycosylase/DNA-(apurinic or apyrimidinic site) lyase [Occallatibacter riparius]UWZ85953.1 bifunctional DNA-formamidopyrimidine glycosylase/DNA-(apurinic or apyrimidinic site) lyase [Occallatibacter riparius]
MPELPEVETVARGVDARVRGDKIAEAWFSSYPQTFKTSPQTQAKGLEGRTILEVHRTGKHIVCELASDAATIDAQWIVHLGMTGRLLVTTPDAPLAPHTHARLRLESGREIRFVDPRRFGRLEFRKLKKANGFEAKGAEPLSIDSAPFAQLFRGRKLAIKAALLNQTLLSGVGNIYADESLFRAGIRPRRAAGRLSRAELEKLRLALQAVLLDAIRLGGSSVSDYVDAEGVRGFFQLEHRVYQRAGEPCLVCSTPIRRIVVGGRSTHYCPQCQK